MTDPNDEELVTKNETQLWTTAKWLYMEWYNLVNHVSGIACCLKATNVG